MSLNCDEVQQLTAIGALGALDGADLSKWRERLERDPDARAELTRFLDVAGALAGLVVPRRPSPSVRARVLERIRRTPQQGAAPGAAQSAGEDHATGVGNSQASAGSGAAPGVAPAGWAAAVPEGFQFIRSDAPWLPAPLPGARYKVLSASPAQAHILLMIELAPGALYPEHDHLGTEDMYVLTGDLQSEGRSLGPGDFLHAEPGTHHHELRSIEGCTALMIVPREAVGGLVGV
jgi:quercetin dioxygenase-like cupin family protein